MDFKSRLRERRIELELTLEDVARALGTTRQTIQKYESGVVTNIPSDKIEKMAEVLKTTPAYLMGWTKDQDTFRNEQNDVDIRRIARARKQMPPEEQEKMMKILTAAFGMYFSDDGKNGR